MHYSSGIVPEGASLQKVYYTHNSRPACLKVVESHYAAQG